MVHDNVLCGYLKKLQGGMPDSCCVGMVHGIYQKLHQQQHNLLETRILKWKMALHAIVYFSFSEGGWSLVASGWTAPTLLLYLRPLQIIGPVKPKNYSCGLRRYCFERCPKRIMFKTLTDDV